MSLLTLRRSHSSEQRETPLSSILQRSQSDNDLIDLKNALVDTRGDHYKTPQDNSKESRDVQGYIVSPYSAFSILLFEKDQIRSYTNQTNSLSEDLKAMIEHIRFQDDLKMAIRLESRDDTVRLYLTLIVSDSKFQSALVGFSFTQKCAHPLVSVVVPIFRITNIVMTGEGGFKVCTQGERGHVFHPMSLKSLWSSLQIIYDIFHKISKNYKKVPMGSTYFDYYAQKIPADPSILALWNENSQFTSTARICHHTKNEDKSEIHRHITYWITKTLSNANIETITMRQIRFELEQNLKISLENFNKFIDNETMRIFGQMDACTKITDHVYLGSEWNAADRDTLHRLGITLILNASKEIDNFFPGVFEYFNISVFDSPDENIMSFFEDSYRFIEKARNNKTKVLVHCQMGISRSATVVISYLMKHFGWNVKISVDYVKARRAIINPNPGFEKQLHVYEGILNSSRNRALFDTNTSRSCVSLTTSSAPYLSSHSSPVASAKYSQDENPKRHSYTDRTHSGRTYSTSIKEHNSVLPDSRSNKYNSFSSAVDVRIKK